jgi:hypothetical protein
VRRAVHRLETMLFVVILNQEHVFLVFSPMTRDFPELSIEEIGCDNFSVSSYAVLLTESLYELIVDVSPIWVEECATR